MQVHYLAQEVSIEYFKDFVEAELAEALHGIANEGRGPPSGQCSYSFLCGGESQGLEHVAVLGWIHLNRETVYLDTYCHIHLSQLQTLVLVQCCVAHTWLSQSTSCICLTQAIYRLIGSPGSYISPDPVVRQPYG